MVRTGSSAEFAKSSADLRDNRAPRNFSGTGRRTGSHPVLGSANLAAAMRLIGAPREPACERHRDIGRIRQFLRSTRAGATAIAAAAVTIIAVGGATLVIDSRWLIDQRDVLKAAADAAAVAASHELGRQLDDDPGMSDADLRATLQPVAERYVVLNLQHLSRERLAKAISTLVVAIAPHRAEGTVDVSAEADLGGTLLSQHMPLFDRSLGTPRARVVSQVESVVNPVEVVLAIDVSVSMWDLLDGTASCTDEYIARGCPAAHGRDNARISIVKEAAQDLVRLLDPGAENLIAIGVVPWHSLVRLGPDAITQWTAEGWAAYPTRRVYGEPYFCKGNNCTPPASVEQALAPTPPESETWMGCLDSHRMGSVGTRAALPATSEFFTVPSHNTFAQAFFPAMQGAAYECATLPLPADFSRNTCYHGTTISEWNTTGYPPADAQLGCSVENPVILPLSTNAETVNTAIDGLVPVGNRTYSALGVLWAQRLLDHAWSSVWGGGVHPVDPAARESQGLRKVIVLLTDGEDSYCGFGNESCADSRIGFARDDACTEAKEAGTEIFVIAAMHPDKVSGTLGDSLRACSSESDASDITYAFLEHSTTDQLEATFATIANQLRVVRRNR